MEKRNKKGITVLWILSILVNIKSIFTDYDVDCSYAITMSYRHITGDKMFIDMWEPHQTSSFLLDILLYSWYKITGSFEGCVIYLQTWGVLIFLFISILIVKTFSSKLGKETANLMAIFFFIFRPKQIVLTEFSNMVTMFSMLLFLSLIKYQTENRKIRYLLLSGLFLCLEAISYPTTVITYFAVLMILFLYSEKRIRDMLIITAECGLLGIAYVGYFTSQKGFSVFVTSLRKIIDGDSSHSDGIRMSFNYFASALNGIVWILLSFIIAFIIYKIEKKKLSKHEPYFPFIMWLCLLISNVFLAWILDNYQVIGYNDWRYANGIILLVGTAYAGFFIKRMNSYEKGLYVSGVAISVSSSLAVLILTNLPISSTINYLEIAFIVSIPFFANEITMNNTCHHCKGICYSFAFGICLLFIFHRGIIIRDYSTASTLLYNIENVVRSGPAKGIFCGYMKYYITEKSLESWDEYVNKGDYVLLVQQDVVDSIFYLYGENKVSNYSTISTTTYNEKLYEYWEEKPERYPDVFIVESWYDELRVDQNSWIMQYISDNCELVGSNEYWWYYKPKKNKVSKR